MLGQLTHCFGAHVHNRTARDVINDDRQTAVRSSGEVRDQTALCGLVVIWRHYQRRICSGVFGGLHKANSFGSVIATRTCNNGRATGCVVNDGLHNQIMLRVAQSRRLACCADGYKPVCAVVQMPINQLFQRGKIHLAVLKRRDECGKRPFEHNTLLLVEWRRCAPLVYPA